MLDPSFVSRVFKHSEVLMINGTIIYGRSDGRGVRPSREKMTVEPSRGLAQGGLYDITAIVSCMLWTGRCGHAYEWLLRLTMSGNLVRWARASS